MKNEEIGEIIVKARKAQKIWAASSLGERSRCLKKAGTYLASKAEEIVRIIHEDTGKLPLDALAAEVLPAIMALSYYCKKFKRFLASQSVGGGSLLMFNKKSRLCCEPYGVIGIISPWNYPFSIPFSEVVMALLAGNAVLLKTASLTANVGRALETIFKAADLPQDLFTYIEMPGAEAGSAFIGTGNNGVDKLFFTGSTTTGKKLMALAARDLKPLVLELGGADSAIIREDADIDRSAAGMVWAGFSNAGQSCGGVQKILVHQNIYDAFLEKFCTLVKELREGIDLGKMATLKQKQLLSRQVEKCLKQGAVVAAKSEGAFLQNEETLSAPAIVLTGIKETMPIMTEELFGPVVGIIRVKDDEEALRIANSSSYALTGSVWTKNRRKGKALAVRVNAGAVMVNDHLMSHGLAETPWGGFGDSGIGRTHGELGFREMVKIKVIVNDILPGVKRNLFWQPYSEKVYAGIFALVELLSGTFVKRMAALPKVTGIFFRYWSRR